MRFLLIFLALAACLATPQPNIRNDLQPLFHTHGITQGTFVLLDVQTNHITVVNETRARQRFIPASTFKIANSLIALETSAVKDELEIIPYGGKPQLFKQWEQDMPMRDAIRISNVPVYQEIASRIGQERMRENVMRLGYGNQTIGQVIDRFWLDGPLKISAIEQAQFLAKLTQSALPISQEKQATVRRMLKQDNWNGMEFYAKTGWVWHTSPQTGWLVGWVVKNNRAYTFALNIDIHHNSDADARYPLVKEMLQRLVP